MPYKDKEKQKAHDTKYSEGYNKEHRKSKKENIIDWKDPKQKAEYHRKYYHTHTEQVNLNDRKSHRKQRLAKYSLTQETFNILKRQQENKCLICQEMLTDRNMVIDHDHKTDKVRGLLCRCCNGVLGLAKDSPDILLKAIEYLKINQ